MVLYILGVVSGVIATVTWALLYSSGVLSREEEAFDRTEEAFEKSIQEKSG